MLQKRSLRIISNARYNSHTDPLFKNMSIMKVCDMVECESLLFMHDYRTNTLPVSFNDNFTLNRQLPQPRLTRQSEQYHVARSRSQFVSRLPLFTIPLLWNKWESPSFSVSTKGQLKSTIKRKFIENYQAQVRCNNPRCGDCSI